MTERTDGGAAFPQPDLSSYGMGPTGGSQAGMSLRDWFAGQVLPAVFLQMNEPEHDYCDVAGAAWAMADAMLAERAK